jgi:hypothetical protein
LELVNYVRRNYLIAPAQNETEYALNATKLVIDPSMGQSKKIRQALQNKASKYFCRVPFYFVLFNLSVMLKRLVDFLLSAVLWTARRVPIHSIWRDSWAGEGFWWKQIHPM